jgi:hypothetical protein
VHAVQHRGSPRAVKVLLHVLRFSSILSECLRVAFLREPWRCSCAHAVQHRGSPRAVKVLLHVLRFSSILSECLRVAFLREPWRCSCAHAVQHRGSPRAVKVLLHVFRISSILTECLRVAFPRAALTVLLLACSPAPGQPQGCQGAAACVQNQPNWCIPKPTRPYHVLPCAPRLCECLRVAFPRGQPSDGAHTCMQSSTGAAPGLSRCCCMC